MTYGARLFYIILALQFLIAKPIHLEYPIIPKIDCQDINKNGYLDFIAVNNSISPRSLYHIEIKDSVFESLWEYSMPDSAQGYFANMIFGDFDNDGIEELISVAYQDGKQEIFYIFSIDSMGKYENSPKIMGIKNSIMTITQPRKLYPMSKNLDGHKLFILTQGSPNRQVIMCEYIEGKINSVGSLGKNFLKKTMGPLELALGNFNEDSIEDIFILSNDASPEGYFIFSDGTEEEVPLSNFPHLNLLHNRGKDINFDGIEDLIMVNRDGGLMSNIWAQKSILLSENKIQDIIVNLENGLIHLNSISQIGERGNLIIDPLSLKILTSEYTMLEFSGSDFTEVYSLTTKNKILLTNNGKDAELLLLPFKMDQTAENQAPTIQKEYSRKPDYVINVGDVFVHSIVRDTTKTFIQFIGEYLPSGMEINLNDIQLEWAPNNSQLGFYEFSYKLELRESGELEMEIADEKKLVSQKENIIDEKHTYLIYVNEPIKFNSKEKHIKIENTKPYEWIININDNNIDALLDVQKLKGATSAKFQLIQSEEDEYLVDSAMLDYDEIKEIAIQDTQFQETSNAIINTHKAKFFWTPNTMEDSIQFSLIALDQYSSDTLDFVATIHPEIDLKMNQTEYIGTVNQTINIPIILEQSPPSINYTYAILNPPENMRITQNGIINWIPLPTQVDNYSFEVEVSDGFASSKLQYNIYINAPPVISSRPSEHFFLTLGDSLYFPLESFDMNMNAKLSWGLNLGPVDMILDSAGVLKWQGDILDHHPYEIQLSDGIDSTIWNGSIYVNALPIIVSEPITLISENEAYLYSIDVQDDNKINPLDPNSENIFKFKLINGPSSMVIDTSVLHWTMEGKSPGEYLVSIEVSDGLDKTIQNFQLMVNASPVITSIDSIPIILNDTLNFQVKANDLNPKDSLSYFIDNIRSGMDLDKNSGLLTWIPSHSDVGQHNFNLQVKDGHNESSANQELQIFVYENPIFTGDMPTEAFLELEYSAFLTGKDMFGEKIRDEKISIEMSTISDYKLSEYGRYFQWTPTKIDIGKQHIINIRIIDTYGFKTLHTHKISVFSNPCSQCDSKPIETTIDTTRN